jgi:hypothetical protein
MRWVQQILVVAALAILLPALALAGPPTEVQDATNRRAIENLRASDPQAYARLRHNLAVFMDLPPDKQEALRKLDREMQDEITTMRNRLERVADRYADWLERLPEADRKSILSAPDRKTRLQRIRAVREAEWVKRQPKPVAERIAKAPPREKADLIKKLQQEELEDKLDWQVAQRHWDQIFRAPQMLPVKADQLPEDTRDALEKTLRPLLSRHEEQLLKDNEGKWPRYPRVLVELADSHPISVLGPIGPTNVKELQLNKFGMEFLQKEKKGMEKLREAEGKWPEFGLALREVGRLAGPFGGKGGRIIPPLHGKFAPSKPADFSSSVQQFIEKKLVPALDDDEGKHLKNTEGEWPAYPRMVMELARKHNLQVPGGSPRFDQWDRYRWRSLTSGKSKD